MTRESSCIYVVSAETDKGTAALLMELLPGLDLDLSVWQDESRDYARLDAYADNEPAARACRARIKRFLRVCLPGTALRFQIRPVAREDWAESWKRFFGPIRVGRSLVVKPSWSAYPADPCERVVELDPGLSFGTGNHPTTQGCLRFLEERARAGRAERLLDLGCGSGILSIAAAKLGFAAVTALDNDAEAVRTARENCARNGVSAIVNVQQRELAELGEEPAYDLVVANILAGPLIAHARRIAGQLCTASNGSLVLSGILEEQYPAALAAYEQLAFEERAALREQGWVTCRLSRTAPG